VPEKMETKEKDEITTEEREGTGEWRRQVLQNQNRYYSTARHVTPRIPRGPFTEYVTWDGLLGFEKGAKL